ncbi:MAG: glycosyltransferase family 4 protein [Candidatus Nanopelagicales bacterium]
MRDQHADSGGAQPPADVHQPLRIALLSYRSKAHSGGQGIYIRHLSRELAALGHDVEVISGPPYPPLDAGPRLTKVPSLDLYREPDPFRVPRPSEFRSPIDVYEFLSMCTGAFPEPLTFSMRARRLLSKRPAAQQPDIIHDNQTLGYGMVLMEKQGLPVVATIHHPITVDKSLELASANLRRKFMIHRWYSFLRMQRRVAQRMPEILTVSESSGVDIAASFGVDQERITVVPLGVEHDVFVPPTTPRVPGRIVTTASADVPLKGLVPLLEALAKLRTERDVHLIVVGSLREGGATEETLERLDLHDAVEFRSDVAESDLVELFGSAQVAVVPSLYEGFSLPAVEIMACATPLVATNAGALPEVVGPDGEAALRVEPGDPQALAVAIGQILDDDDLAARLGATGRKRVIENYTWSVVAARTADWYRRCIAERAEAAATAPAKTTMSKT